MLEINRGERIAQMICHKTGYPSVIEYSEMSLETVRGTKSFGS